MPGDRKRLYFVLFGHFTGDIWHVAAAMLLWKWAHANNWGEKIPYLNEYEPVLASVANLADDAKDMKKNAKGSHAYFRHIGLPVIVHKVENRSQNPTIKKGKEDVPNPHRIEGAKERGLQIFNGRVWRLAMRYERFEQLYKEQVQDASPLKDFQSIWDSLQGLEGIQTELKGPKPSPPEQERILRYDCSTTILMDLMQHIGQKECIEYLAGAMWQSGNDDTDKATLNAAKLKLNELKAACDENRKPSGKPVILFNHRKSDFNASLNSNFELLLDVKNDAEAANHVVTPVAVGLASDAIAEAEKGSNLKYFDLFGVKNNPAGFQEKAITACFWALVAYQLQIGATAHPTLGDDFKPSNPFIQGIIGGRSGSMDIPAFVGFNAVSWDAPFWDEKFVPSEPADKDPPPGEGGPSKPPPKKKPAAQGLSLESEVVMLARLLNAYTLTPVVWYEKDLKEITGQELDEIKEGSRKRKLEQTNLDPSEELNPPSKYPTGNLKKDKPAKYTNLEKAWVQVVLNKGAGHVPQVKALVRDDQKNAFVKAYKELTVHITDFTSFPTGLEGTYGTFGIMKEINSFKRSIDTAEPSDDTDGYQPAGVYPVQVGESIDYMMIEEE